MPYCRDCGALLEKGSLDCPNCRGNVQVSGSIPLQEPELPMPENVAGVLAYLVVPAIVFLLVEPYRRNFFVRFHSVQCLLTTGALLACAVVLLIVSGVVRYIPFIGVFLVLLAWPLFGLAGSLLWLLVVYKTYEHAIFKLPFVGEIAESQAKGE